MKNKRPNRPATSLDMLIVQIEHILDVLQQVEQAHEGILSRVHPANLESARNLIHYMALRSFDLRQLQEHLTVLGVSSIAHSEGYVLKTIQNILRLLHLLHGVHPESATQQLRAPFDYFQSRAQLVKNTDALFGPRNTTGNHTRVMVTMPIAAVSDYPLLVQLLREGMNLIRINTSHDEPADWAAMVSNIRKAEIETGRHCRIYIDLSGPKLRTRIPVLLRQSDQTRLKHNGSIRLFRGDQIAIIDPIQNPFEIEPYEDLVMAVPITLPEIFQDVETGHTIYFDDGKIGARITQCTATYFIAEVFQAAIEGSGLGAEKGVNLPETPLTLFALTSYDHATLPFIAQYADIVGYSFVRRPTDIEMLQSKLRQLGREDIGITLKIETKEAFDHLPTLLLTAMRSPKVGVMIARGDLAVEIGFERNAEVQEEILWICEAAHVPGIWATQVLERMAKKGLATRSEITDAAMASRAECVMLNKGPHILEAVRALGDILQRMERHQHKRWGSLRPLSVAKRFVESR